jgi:hypothetical protein
MKVIDSLEIVSVCGGEVLQTGGGDDWSYTGSTSTWNGFVNCYYQNVGFYGVKVAIGVCIFR